MRIASELQRWAEDHAPAQVTTESVYVLSEQPATVRGPDVAVEILSPSDASTAIQSKTLDYLEAGAARVWIVDPEARTVTVYRPDGSATLLKEGDTLSGEDVLADFVLPRTE